MADDHHGHLQYNKINIERLTIENDHEHMKPLRGK